MNGRRNKQCVNNINMKKTIYLLGLGAVLLASCGDKEEGAEASAKTTDAKASDTGVEESSANVNMTNLKDSASYAIGMSVANNLKQSQGITELNTALIKQAFDDVLGSGSTKLAPGSDNQIVQAYFASLKEGQFAENKAASEAFLAENSKREGVITLPSGLQYEVVTMGTGPKPTTADQVKAHYRGTRIDGTQFDSSYDRGEPSTFPVTGVIKGWIEALQLMPVGSKWKLYIPQDMAYGANPRPGVIQPYDALIFDIELVEIIKK